MAGCIQGCEGGIQGREGRDCHFVRRQGRDRGRSWLQNGGYDMSFAALGGSEASLAAKKVIITLFAALKEV